MSQASRWQDVGIAILGPFPPRPGGVSVQCATLATHLSQAGARVARINTDLPGLRQHGAWGKTLLPAAQVGHLLRRLKQTRHQWQILHVHAASWWGFMPAVVALQARRWRKRLVLSYHGGEAAAFMARYGWFATKVLSQYQALLTLTATQAEIFQRHHLSSTVVPNIVPVDAFRYRPRGPVAPRLLWLRHLEARYRPHDALTVFERVRQTYPQATLRMVGGGPMLATLQVQASAGVTITGPAPSSALPDIYNDAEIFLNTSAVDNLPLTLIEASASGLPIISTNAGAIPDLIHDGKDGLLAPVGDIETLSAHIVRLLAQPELAKRLSAAAHHNAQRFAWPQIEPLLARAYDLA